MLKRKRNLFLINVTIFQIILLITTSFSISFLFSEYVGLGSAQISAFRSATAQRLLSKQGLSTTGASGATPPIGNVNEQLLADLGKQQYGGSAPLPGTGSDFSQTFTGFSVLPPQLEKKKAAAGLPS